MSISKRFSLWSPHVQAISHVNRIDPRRVPQSAPYGWRGQVLKNHLYRGFGYPVQFRFSADDRCVLRIPPPRKCRGSYLRDTEWSALAGSRDLMWIIQPVGSGLISPLSFFCFEEGIETSQNSSQAVVINYPGLIDLSKWPGPP